ncbi:MAG TPA: energy transducer TonB [Alphaproteobacteria bacterium]|jgi:TonB family protein|nr:energy transducer TonB [Alphaproteobacteria bacterium]
MRASNDFFVVGIAGIGTALFVCQLLAVSAQISAANKHVQAELAAENAAVPFTWMGTFKTVSKPVLTWFNPGCCPPFDPPSNPRHVGHYDISSARIAGNPIFKATPVYPERAADRGISGFVDFVFTTSPDGSVVDPEVVAEVPEGYGFAAAATQAFRRWRFEPSPSVDGLGPTLRYRMSFRLSKQ